MNFFCHAYFIKIDFTKLWSSSADWYVKEKMNHICVVSSERNSKISHLNKISICSFISLGAIQCHLYKVFTLNSSPF